jgi:hypothetical protein
LSLVSCTFHVCARALLRPVMASFGWGVRDVRAEPNRSDRPRRNRACGTTACGVVLAVRVRCCVGSALSSERDRGDTTHQVCYPVSRRARGEGVLCLAVSLSAATQRLSEFLVKRPSGRTYRLSLNFVVGIAPAPRAPQRAAEPQSAERATRRLAAGGGAPRRGSTFISVLRVSTFRAPHRTRTRTLCPRPGQFLLYRGTMYRPFVLLSLMCQSFSISLMSRHKRRDARCRVVSSCKTPQSSVRTPRSGRAMRLSQRFRLRVFCTTRRDHQAVPRCCPCETASQIRHIVVPNGSGFLVRIRAFVRLTGR